MELVFSFHLYLGSETQTQVIELLRFLPQVKCYLLIFYYILLQVILLQVTLLFD